MATTDVTIFAAEGLPIGLDLHLRLQGAIGLRKTEKGNVIEVCVRVGAGGVESCECLFQLDVGDLEKWIEWLSTGKYPDPFAGP